MTNSLIVRDFFKEYREVKYSNSGSIRLTEIEHNAYLNRLTIEVTHYDAPRAINYKTLPENTHWGYMTAFKGSSVMENTPIKFAKQRAYECINQSIWDYHQSTENINLLSSFDLEIAQIVVAKLLDEGVPIPGFEKFLVLNEAAEDNNLPVLEWLVGIEDSGSSDFPEETDPYTAYPIASPFPDVFKFKSDIPCAFVFRLESWYLVNPAVYIVANPTDSSDATEGEDEYPTPEPGDGNGDGGEFPPVDLPDGESDPRDYDPANFGDQGVWNVSIRYSDGGNNPPCNDVPPTTFQIRGYKNQVPSYVRRGAENQFGAQSAFLVTSIAEVQVGETCATAVNGIPVFFADD